MRNGRTIVALLTGLVALGVTSACERLTDEEWVAVERWLLCSDCVEGELARVDSIAQLKPSATVDVLAETLTGPHANAVDNVRHQFSDSWRRAREAGAPAVAETTYVREFAQNFVAMYQVRSALALAEIGTDKAKDVLTSAVRRDSMSGEYREDVRLVLHGILTQSTYDTLPGLATPSVVRFGDTVTVTATGGPAWTGSEVASLPGAPFPDDMMVGTADATDRSLQVVAAAPIGTYAIVVANIGNAGQTFWLPAQIASYAGALHTPDAPLGLGEAEARNRQFAPLGARAAQLGSTHLGPSSTYFRLEGPDTTILGVLDWRGDAQVVPLAYPCGGGPSNIADTLHILGTVIDERGDPIPGITPYEAGVGSWDPTDRWGTFEVTEDVTYSIAYLPTADPWRIIPASRPLTAQVVGGIRGRVTDSATGTSIRNAMVRIEGSTLSGTTGMMGFYNIHNVPAGMWDVRATGIGYQPRTLTDERILSGQTTTLNFALEPVPPDSQLLSVGSQVNAASFTFTRSLDLGRVPRGSADTIVVLHESGREALAASNPDTFAVRLAPWSSGSLRGRVTDAATGDPVPGARVLVASLPPARLADTRGRYVVEDLAPASYSVRVEQVGYRPVEIQDQPIVAGRVTVLDLALEQTTVELTPIVVSTGAPPGPEVHCAVLRVARLDARDDRTVVRLTADLVAPADSFLVDGPGSLSLATGDVQLLATKAWTAGGTPLTGRPVHWFTTDPSVAEVGRSGQVTARAAGTARVIASLEGRRDTVLVAVTP